MKQRQVWWYVPPSESSSTFLQSALTELGGFLASAGLAEIAKVLSVPTDHVSDLQCKIDSAVGENDLQSVTSWWMYKFFPTNTPCPIGIIYCPSHQAVKSALLKWNPAAEWGAACAPVAWIVKPNDKYVLWHETLHLLGADDCYQLPDRGPNCDCPNCIMQYEPSQMTVGAWPFLCKKNIDQIQA